MGFKQKIRNIQDCRDSSSIYDVYYNEKIDERLIYFESRNGRDFAGNIFRIIEELSTGKYGDFKIHVFANAKVKSRIEAYKKNYNLKIDRIITSQKEATKTLEKAKFIFTDSGIQYKYVKRDSQIFVNMWHGTPLKLMGRDYPHEVASLGHIQHALLSADYLLYPNEYMMDIMLEAYQIGEIYPGKILLEGYPRNSVFFDDARRLQLKRELELEDKDVFIYMPTYRGTVQEIDSSQKDFIADFLDDIDEKLDENQVLISKLHPYDESDIDYSNFKNVIRFPDAFELYDILNICNVLITDYSSVFFDYANSSGKIVLFNYDEDEYLSSRGVYIPLKDLPFPKVQDVDSLVDELNSPKDYDDADFLRKLKCYDNIDAAKHICQHIFKNAHICSEKQIETIKKNVLIYPGKIDGSFRTLIDSIKDEFNVFITYKQWESYYKEVEFPGDVYLLPLRYNLTPTVDEKRHYNRYFSSKDANSTDALDRLFKRSYDKQYGNLDFAAIIDFDPTDAELSSMFANSAENSIIWIHADTFKKANMNVLANILPKFKTVVVDNTELCEEIKSITENNNVIISNKIHEII